VLISSQSGFTVARSRCSRSRSSSTRIRLMTRLCQTAPSPQVRFAQDSLLEGDGFKPSVPSLTQTRSNGDVQHPCAAVGHARLAHPTIRDDYPPYPRSVIAGTNA
jgi:hypothetical protein